MPPTLSLWDVTDLYQYFQEFPTIRQMNYGTILGTHHSNLGEAFSYFGRKKGLLIGKREMN